MVAANALQQGTKLWDIALELSQHKYLINLLNVKYGWERQDSFEDTQQELCLITYKVLSEYEQAHQICLLNLDNNKKTKQHLINNIIGRYRVQVWNHRSENAIRKSDIYNIEVDSLDNSNVYCGSLDNNLHEYVGNKIAEKIEDTECNNRRQTVCKALTSILNVNVEELLNLYLFGSENKGLMTHAEIAQSYEQSRSAVTRKLNRAVKAIQTFIKKTGITYRELAYPTMKDMQNILGIINKYNQEKTNKIIYNNSLSEFIKHNTSSIHNYNENLYLEDFTISLNIYNHQDYKAKYIQHTVYEYLC